MPGRVVLAMSGGVDSSVAAYLLKKQGYEVIGLFMRTGVHGNPETNSERTRGCCSALDAGDARRVADQLDIPFYALDFEKDFDRIIDYFADEYLAGRTPNPCVVCNDWLKFGKLWSYGQQLDADFIATGHYSRIEWRDGEPQLHRAVDSAKDQSYVLHGIRRSILPRLLFPIGGMEKPALRVLAREAGLRVADKPDSVEICFVPDGDHAGLIRTPGGRRPRIQADLSTDLDMGWASTTASSGLPLVSARGSAWHSANAATCWKSSRLPMKSCWGPKKIFWRRASWARRSIGYLILLKAPNSHARPRSVTGTSQRRLAFAFYLKAAYTSSSHRRRVP